jgi:hypothetical protein
MTAVIRNRAIMMTTIIITAAVTRRPQPMFITRIDRPGTGRRIGGLTRRVRLIP